MQNEEALKGIVFNIQRYSIHDGPGIRSTVFLKGCPLRCFWCQNPESWNVKPEIMLNRNLCTLCGRCIDVCPGKACSISGNKLVIDRSRCTGCGKCENVCVNHARSIAGKLMSAGEVLEEVLKDRVFYRNSGGGVTISGGEPGIQHEFALRLLRHLKDENVHTALETCGHIPWENLEKLIKYLDLVLYDLKHIDPSEHKRATGVSNLLIIENLKRISALRKVIVRVPLIPGFNDSPEHIRSVNGFVRKEIGPVEIDLLPYNKLGEIKYEHLDRHGIKPSGEVQGDEYLEMLSGIIDSVA